MGVIPKVRNKCEVCLGIECSKYPDTDTTPYLTTGIMRPGTLYINIFVIVGMWKMWKLDCDIEVYCYGDIVKRRPCPVATHVTPLTLRSYNLNSRTYSLLICTKWMNPSKMMVDLSL